MDKRGGWLLVRRHCHEFEARHEDVAEHTIKLPFREDGLNRVDDFLLGYFAEAAFFVVQRAGESQEHARQQLRQEEAVVSGLLQQ